jgi:hypothetical protein
MCVKVDFPNLSLVFALSPDQPGLSPDPFNGIISREVSDNCCVISELVL